MRILLAGTAALALAASGAYAQGKGNGNGNGGDNPAGAQQKDNKGNGNKAGGPPSRAGQGKPGKEDKSSSKKADRGPEHKSVQGNKNGQGSGQNNANTSRSNGNNERKRDRRVMQTRDNRNDTRVRYDDNRRTPRGDRDLNWLVQDHNRSLVNGCPPGLAKKNNGCNPPGQVRERYERNLFGYNYRPSMFGLSSYDRRGDYYYNDGYLVRYGNSGGISSWLPLLGGALGIGNVWPSGYQSYNVPDYYVDYYDLGGPDSYRYADNVIYRVDPENDAITSIAALITGDEISVGQPMPSGYDVYNVPYAYRDRYYDSPERMYRYSDGYVYEVDPETRLVAAAIDLLI